MGDEKTALFGNYDVPLNLILGLLDSGELGLPDIQRPFVWGNSKVRNLFDSLYRGYPMGSCLL